MSPTALTVAGSDPTGGAGLQADLKTFQALGAHGISVATLITSQDTALVRSVYPLPAEVVRAQLEALLADVDVAAAKTGALGSADTVGVVAGFVRDAGVPWVVDPVAQPSRGASLGGNEVLEALREALLPHAAIVTPNVEEAAALSGIAVESLGDAERAATRIAALGPNAVLVKGGHLPGDGRGIDVLWYEGSIVRLAPARVLDVQVHGTGCALASAIACHLAHGRGTPEAVKRAKAWLETMLLRTFSLGRGAQLLNYLRPSEGKT